jgi:ribosomal protein S18 acetylase RimI-like enzyme
MQIRKASQDDVSGFIECYLEIWMSLRGTLPEEYVSNQINRASGTPFYNYILSEILDPSCIILVTEDESEIIGLAWGSVRDDGSSWLAFLGVSPDHRRRGIGRSLLKRFIEESKKKGSCVISLDTDPRLVPAVRLYENSGFAYGGVTKNQYGLELVIYTKTIQ